jgi:hypothetical protein
VRLAGDLVDDLAQYRSWGGLLKAVALALFAAYTASAALTRSKLEALRC